MTFRERFLNWKETGVSPYKAGRLKEFDEGKNVSEQESAPVIQDRASILDYLSSIEQDFYTHRTPMFDKGKDQTSYRYTFDEIPKVDQNAGLSYTNYYDKLTGDVFMDTKNQAVPTFDEGKSNKFDAFINRMAPVVIRNMRNKGIPMHAFTNIMTQLAWESEYGTSPAARNKHNYGGIFIPGKKEYITFNNDDAFMDYYLSGKLLGNKKRYGNVFEDIPLQEFSRRLKFAKDGTGGYYGDTYEHYTNGLLGMKTYKKHLDAYKKNNDIGDGNAYKYSEKQYKSDIENNARQAGKRDVTDIPHVEVPQRNTVRRQGITQNEFNPNIPRSISYGSSSEALHLPNRPNIPQMLDLLKQRFEGLNLRIPTVDRNVRKK